MPANQPQEVIQVFVKLFNSGDLDALLEELYEDDAMLIPAPDGSVTVSGKSGVRDALQGFLDMGGTISLHGATAFEHGDIALTHSHWRLDFPSGDPTEATTAEIVRRQPDGSWKYILDNPWGGGVLHATT